MGVGHHAQDGDLCPFLQHGQAGGQQAHISPELVDEAAGHPVPLLGLQEGQGAVELGKDAPPVNVPHQQDGGVHQLGQTHVDDVVGLEVDFRRAACPLDDEDVILPAQAVVGLQQVGDEFLFLSEIVRRPVLPPHPAMDDELTAHVAGGF